MDNAGTVVVREIKKVGIPPLFVRLWADATTLDHHSAHTINQDYELSEKLGAEILLELEAA